MAFLLLGICAIWPANGFAEEDSGWSHRVTLYFIGAGLSGDVAVKGVPLDVDMSLGDILENLDFGFMGNYRVQKNRGSVGTDIIYLGLGTSGERGRAELDVDYWMVELSAGYEVSPLFTAIAGLRYHSLSNRLFFPVSENEVKATEDWVDPLVGGRLTWRLGTEWSAHLRGDVGGFGIGSDFAWQLLPLLEWMPSERLSGLLGYRVIYTDYENEDQEFKYDMTVTGPTLGLAAHF